MQIKIKRFDKTLPLPASDKNAVGFDFVCREEVTIAPGEIKLIPSNIAVQVPVGFALMVFARSSTPLKRGLMLANGVGIVDPFYCGEKDEILLQFINISKQPVTIERGAKIAQGVFIKHEVPEWAEVDSMGEVGEGGYWTTKQK